jgi:hypothetical protein
MTNFGRKYTDFSDSVQTFHGDSEQVIITTFSGIFLAFPVFTWYIIPRILKGHLHDK